MRCIDYLKADVYRVSKTYDVKQIIKNAIFNRTFRPVVTLRLCQSLNNKKSIFAKILLFFFRILHKIFCNIINIELHWKTKIGAGFCLTHGLGTVINEEAIIGSNVTIFHGVTLGTKHAILENGEILSRCPIIEDNVWIGANSVIVGDVIIGKSSRVAPLSMIVKDVQANTIVGCNPQRVLKTNTKEDVWNKVPIEKLDELNLLSS